MRPGLLAVSVLACSWLGVGCDDAGQGAEAPDLAQGGDEDADVGATDAVASPDSFVETQEGGAESDTTSGDLCATDEDCQSPPGPKCAGDYALWYDTTGLCQPNEQGQLACHYYEVSKNCSIDGYACFEGQCVESPCSFDTCEEAPPPQCDGDLVLTWSGFGDCSVGADLQPSCDYGNPAVTDCAFTGETCLQGVCVATSGSCAGVLCQSPPPPGCFEGIAVSWGETGACVVQGTSSVCEYPVAEQTDCAAKDLLCLDGACVHPCSLVTCEAPPAPACYGDAVVRHADVGTCSLDAEGLTQCTYPLAELVDCAASGLACEAGACQ